MALHSKHIPALLALALPPAAPALEVTIQDTTLHIRFPGDLCIKLAGEYRGVRVESSEAGKTAKVCYDTIRKNLVILTDTTFISTDPAGGEVEIRFHHRFPPGPNGLILAQMRLVGFFATATGAGVATGSHIELHGSIMQSLHDNWVGEGLVYTVGEDLESGGFDLEDHTQYLISSDRVVRGTLNFRFVAQGDKLTLPHSAAVGLEAVPRLQEKFEDAEEGITNF